MLPLFLSVASVPTAGVLTAQEPDQGRPVVRVTAHRRDPDADGLLIGALVGLSGHARRYVTGMNGRVSFEVPADRHALVATGECTRRSELISGPGARAS